MVSGENRVSRRDLSTHILAASVVMIGVSTTLIGLVKVAKGHMGASRVDQFTAVATMLFLVSAIASYLSIRYTNIPHLSERCESIADQVFICGLIGICVIAALFAYEVI
ncbi:hypothetical protein NLM16_38895 [Bradyrhizobium brasilense]|uniref:hypothetical protein n=1 Tax=Bradyrhizobium brasilense TaxID=1419277 RepID=UPI002877314E|nr:hypothetical protein [Bradyrhizobium brasilense]MCP3420081.1 hypothetical protein [Bradyrhizobium brasilense]